MDTNFVDWDETGGPPKKPVLVIHFKGSDSELQDRLESPEAGRPYPNEIDITFRLRSHRDESDASGVLTISNRLTGEHMLEFETDAKPVFDFVHAVHRYADETGKEVQYYIDLKSDEGTGWDWEKQVLAVRASDGDLLRGRSLLPTWVEL